MVYEVHSPNVTGLAAAASRTSIFPEDVHSSLRKHMLVDGFEMVVDLRKSEGSYIYDSLTERRYLDFFTFFASSPVGVNHPAMMTEEFKDRLFHAAVNKPSNSDIYTVEMAEFVATFSRVGIPRYLPHAFFVSGGALAVENALKTAFDWKVRRNYAKGYKQELGHKVIHFRQAFHGRTGYTLPMTNTADPRKTMYFPKLDWPRISNPALRFPLNEENLLSAERMEKLAYDEITDAFGKYGDDIAAIIIEPIQGEGGDNHFRPEFFHNLRRIADEYDALLIFDEVQTGVGLSGRMWAHEYFVEPDILCFGKKMQVCGILAGKRIDEVPNNVFVESSRINSTWGSDLTDMVRSQKYLEIIEEEHLVENSATVGAYLLDQLRDLVAENPGVVSNARGRGLMCAIDFPTEERRNAVQKRCFEGGLLILPSGTHSIRFRPALNIAKEQLDEGLAIIREAIHRSSAI